MRAGAFLEALSSLPSASTWATPVRITLIVGDGDHVRSVSPSTAMPWWAGTREVVDGVHAGQPHGGDVAGLVVEKHGGVVADDDVARLGCIDPEAGEQRVSGVVVRVVAMRLGYEPMSRARKPSSVDTNMAAQSRRRG